MDNIITDIPTCQKENCTNLCKPSKWTKSGFTAYCTRAHANSRSHNDETKKKIKNSTEKYFTKNPGNSKDMKFYHKNNISRIFSVLPIPEDIVFNIEQINLYFSNRFYKRVLANYSCEECGISHWKGKRAYLEIDHINGNKKNNRLENFRVLCVNCHSQTDTYKNKNSYRTINKNLLNYDIYNASDLSLDKEFDAANRSYKKKFVFYQQGFMCHHCGVSKWNFKRLSMELEHIDGDKTNNERSNLCVLCPNCHAQTNTFRCLNHKK